MLYIVDLQATRKEAFLMEKVSYDNVNQKLIEEEVKPVLKLNNIIKNISINYEITNRNIRVFS